VVSHGPLLTNTFLENGTDDPDEGVSGALVYLRAQAAPNRLAVETGDTFALKARKKKPSNAQRST